MQDVFKGPGFAVGLAMGIPVGLAVLWCALHPQIGGLVVRVLARVVGVVALGFGVGWVVTSLGDFFTGNRDIRYESPLGQGAFGSALGWGAAGLVVGITTLVLSFLRTGSRPKAPNANSAVEGHKPQDDPARRL